MTLRGTISALVALVLLASPLATRAADKQITDVKQLAGTWKGWVKSNLAGSDRVSMIVKEDGSYQSSTSGTGGTSTVGKFYLQGGKVKYRSTRTQGSVVITEDNGKTVMTVTPEGSFNPVSGPATYERAR